MIKRSFTLRVLAINFLVLALPLLVSSFVFFQQSYTDAVKAARAKLKEVANYRTQGLTAIQPVKQVLLAELEYIYNLADGFENLDMKELTKNFSLVAKKGGDFQILLLSLPENSHFKIVASSDPALVNTYFTSYLRLTHVLETGEGSFIRYTYFYSDEEGGSYIPHIFVARSILSKKTGKPIGIAMVTADFENALKSILERGERLKNVEIAILNADGIAFASTDPGIQGNYFQPMPSARRKQVEDSGQMGIKKLPKQPLTIIQGDEPPFFEFVFNKKIQIAYRSYIPNTGISVVAYAPKEEFFSAAVHHFLLVYAFYGLIFIFGGGVTYWISLLISRPLRQLSYLMGEVSEGKLEGRFKEEPLGFEINLLGKSFNTTLDTLLANIQKAEDERVKKETYQTEVSIGRQVQYNLLPSETPKIKGAEVAGTYLQAEDVGGDFYGYLSKTLQSGEEVFTCVVADAAERGILSCLYALSARSLFRSYGTLYDDVGEILNLSNNAFLKDTLDTGMFVTALMCMYHTDSKLLTYYSCGHVPGIVRRENGQIEILEHSGMALGLKESQGYKTASIQLYSGDCVVLYTDGLIEAANAKHQHFTQRRLHQILQTQHWESAAQGVEAISAELNAFTRNTPQEEEIILVVLRVE